MGKKPEIKKKDHNLSVSIWAEDRGTNCRIERSYKLKNMSNYETETINCFSSDLVQFHKLLGEAIEAMKESKDYTLKYKSKD